MLFCQVSTAQINELMQSPEDVVDLMQDMGFSTEDNFSEQEILSLIESRYQGQEQTYTTEPFNHTFKLILKNELEKTQLDLFLKGGRNSSICLDGRTIRVLSPLEVKKVDIAFKKLFIPELQQEWSRDAQFLESFSEQDPTQGDLFWLLLSGLTQFFSNAAHAGHCILRAA